MWRSRKLQAGIDLDEDRAIRAYVTARQRLARVAQLPMDLSDAVREAERRWDAFERLERALRAR